MKVKRIEHVAIAVRNLDAARKTFETLGVECDYEETINGIRLAMLPIGESALELLEPQREGTRIGEWIATRGEGLYHICLEDIEAALAELRGRGVGLLDEVPRTGHGGHRIAFLDPRSTADVLVELVEMVEPKPHAA
jgi:methylmalonyl-CoA/ethylmalonyl-CoA epimerase